VGTVTGSSDRTSALARLDRRLASRAPLLAAVLLLVLAVGVVGALGLSASGTAAPAVAAATEPFADVVVLPAWEVAPLPVDVVPSRAPAAAVARPAAPAPSLPSTPAPSRPAAVPAPAAPAPAADPLCSGDGWQQRRGAAALASLRRPSDAASFTVQFEPGRSDVIGLATLSQRRLQVFVRPCAQLSSGLLRHVVAHEMGHLVDATRMTDSLRAQYLAARGIAAGTPWYGCSGCTDFATPAGDFAEVYAQWQAGESSNHSQLAPAPSSAALQAIAAQFFG
jgi:hypothetical protein